jgi:hypothetical protein
MILSYLVPCMLVEPVLQMSHTMQKVVRDMALVALRQESINVRLL